jgi:hypothetical protein
MSESAAPKPRFDPTINLGHLLTFGGFILAGVGAWYGVKSEVANIEYRISSIDKTVERLTTNVEKLTAITVVTARQDEQIAAMRTRIDALERRAP